MTDTPNEQVVLRDDANGVATLTLNRPEKLNALSPAMFVELRAHIDAVAEDDTIGCVVLAAAGRAFSPGIDVLGAARGVMPPSRHHQAETIDALERLPQPTICKIRGHCLSGGLELALGCDILVAADSALIGDNHGQWGLVATWGMTVRLPERVGQSKAKELMFTGRRLSGPEAASVGLVNVSAPDDQLDHVVDEICTEILVNSWDTSRIHKAILADATDKRREEALAHERSTPYGRARDLAERLTRSTGI